MLRRMMISAAGHIPGGGVAYRYWRARVAAPISGSWIAAQEIEFRAFPGGPDLTSPTLTSSRALESGHYDITEGKFAFDDNLVGYVNAAWVSAKNLNPPVFVGWDFVDPTVVREIAWLPQNYGSGPDRCPLTLAIDGSDDKVTWNEVASFAGISGWQLGVWKKFSW